MQQIGKGQLAVLVILFLIGSTPLFELGISAKQDSWLAMLMAAAVGLCCTALYLTLQRRAPGAGFAELFKMHFGTYVGGFFASVQSLWFAYESMRNVRDFGELTSTALLHLTPKWIVMLLVTLAAAYTVSKGVEVFARVVQLLFPVTAISYAFIVMLLFFSGLVRLDNIMPMLADGFAPVAKAAFPDLLAFPFAETLVLLAYWNFVKERKGIARSTLWAQAGVSLFLVFMNLLILCVLGPELAEITALPLLHVAQLVRLANFLERLDIIVTLLLFIGLYVKITALYLASVLMATSITRLPYRYCVLPMGALIYAASFLEPNNTYHLWIGLNLSLKIVLIFQIALPLLMLAVGLRKRYKTGGTRVLPK